jgi:hypothetical protein
VTAIIAKVNSLMEQSPSVDQAVRGAPAVVGAAIGGFTLNAVVLIATALYIVLQIAYLARKWWREEKDYAKKNGGGES